MNYAHSSDLSDGFFLGLYAVCSRFGASSYDALGVMMHESDVRAAAQDPDGHASGIFQLMPQEARGLGWAHGDPRWAQIDAAANARSVAAAALSTAKADGDASAEQDALERITAASARISVLEVELMASFLALSAEGQLPWFEKYYAPHATLLVSPAAWYVATFLPAELAHARDASFVLCGEKGPYPWAYRANIAFDRSKKGTILVQDLLDAIDDSCSGPRWDDIVTRMQAVIDAHEDPPPVAA